MGDMIEILDYTSERVKLFSSMPSHPSSGSPRILLLDFFFFFNNNDQNNHIFMELGMDGTVMKANDSPFNRGTTYGLKAFYCKTSAMLYTSTKMNYQTN